MQNALPAVLPKPMKSAANKQGSSSPPLSFHPAQVAVQTVQHSSRPAHIWWCIGTSGIAQAQACSVMRGTSGRGSSVTSSSSLRRGRPTVSGVPCLQAATCQAQECSKQAAAEHAAATHLLDPKSSGQPEGCSCRMASGCAAFCCCGSGRACMKGLAGSCRPPKRAPADRGCCCCGHDVCRCANRAGAPAGLASQGLQDAANGGGPCSRRVPQLLNTLEHQAVATI